MNRKIIIFLLAILVTSISLCFLPSQHKINISLKGIQRNIGNDDYIEEVIIEVIGIYNKYLFKENSFIGRMSIDLYGDIWTLSDKELLFSDNTAKIVSLNIDNSSKYFGELLCNNKFSEILIIVCEKTQENSYGWSSKDGLYIAAPAKNRSEAIELAEKLANSSIMQEVLWE